MASVRRSIKKIKSDPTKFLAPHLCPLCRSASPADR